MVILSEARVGKMRLVCDVRMRAMASVGGGLAGWGSWVV